MKQIAVRRKDRAMDEEFALKVLDEAGYANISMCDKDEPYSVMISQVRKGNSIYFHCARTGRKIDVLKGNNRVCVSVVTKNEPVYITDFTTLYQSAIFYGNAVFVEDEAEKIEALRILCEKYLPNDMDKFDDAIKKSLKVTQIIRIDFDSFSSKEKKQK